MFSGLTNQMSSLLSTVKGTSTDQEGVAAAAETTGEMAPVAESSAEQEAPLADASGPTDGGEIPAGDDKQR